MKLKLLASFLGFLFLANNVQSQTVSPLQTGHYMTAFTNVRDMGKMSPGLVAIVYDYYAWTNKYVDRNGNKYDEIGLQDLHPALPDVGLTVDANTFAVVPALYWASKFTFLGGANWVVGVVPNYYWADAFFVTEQKGGPIDTTYNQSGSARLSGFGDLFIAPLGLGWGFDHFDATFFYGFTAPTGRYKSGADDNIGMGYWTHQFQGFGYYYPNVDQSTALMLGLTYELNTNTKGEDMNPGNRFSLEWGISQYLSDRFEFSIMGGHNWQVSDDKGSDVYWDPSYHDRKSSLAFSPAYWAVKERLYISAKYMFDFGARQRFLTNGLMLNLIFVTNAMDGVKSKKKSTN